MTRDEAAAALNGNEYGAEGSRELFATMKANGLVAVFGASDDLMEFRGAVHEEYGAYNGGEAYFTKDGLLVECEDLCCHYTAAQKLAHRVEAIWDDGSGYSWTYKTAIPHSTFEIIETDDDEDTQYCCGIVFALADIPS